MVQRTILRLAFPGGKPRPKPGPYRRDTGLATQANGHGAVRVRAEAPGPDGSGPEQRDDGVKVDMP
jgi:linoleoyl-CoA desaturase